MKQVVECGGKCWKGEAPAPRGCVHVTANPPLVLVCSGRKAMLSPAWVRRRCVPSSRAVSPAEALVPARPTFRRAFTSKTPSRSSAFVCFCLWEVGRVGKPLRGGCQGPPKVKNVPWKVKGSVQRGLSSNEGFSCVCLVFCCG